MEKNFLGIPSLQVCNLGLGCMGISEYSGKTNDRESIQTIQRIPLNFTKENWLVESIVRLGIKHSAA